MVADPFRTYPSKFMVWGSRAIKRRDLRPCKARCMREPGCGCVPMGISMGLLSPGNSRSDPKRFRLLARS